MNHLRHVAGRFSRTSFQFYPAKTRFIRSKNIINTLKTLPTYRYYSTETRSQLLQKEIKETDWKSDKKTGEEFFFYNKTRNQIYLVACIGCIIVFVCIIHFTLTSKWFEDHLNFDQNDPTQWPLPFIQTIAILGQLDRYAINPRYVDLLLSGSINKNEDIQSTCALALSALIGDPALCSELGPKIPLTKLLESLRNSQKMDFLTSVCDLLDGLSMKGHNAKYILNKQTLPILADMCLHPNAEIQSKTAGMMANLSKNPEVLESMIRLFPLLHDLYQKSNDDWTKEQAQIALKNILIQGSVDEKYQELLKRAVADVPVEELEKIKSYLGESQLAYRLKAIASAAVLGAGYGFARWSLHASYRGVRGNDLLKLLQKKVPLTSVGAIALYLCWGLDDYIFQNVIEPSQKSESSLLFGNYVWGFTSMFTLLWLSQGLFPFSLVPSIVYPSYRFFREGDRRYDPK